MINIQASSTIFSTALPFCVSPNPPKDTIRRVKSAAKAKGYGVAHSSVRYYDPDSFHGSFRDVESLFWKQTQYSGQQEFRFAIWTGEQSSSSMFLKIGDISNITLRFNTAELNSEKFLGGSFQLPERS